MRLGVEVRAPTGLRRGLLVWFGVRHAVCADYAGSSRLPIRKAQAVRYRWHCRVRHIAERRDGGGSRYSLANLVIALQNIWFFGGSMASAPSKLKIRVDLRRSNLEIRESHRTQPQNLVWTRH